MLIFISRLKRHFSPEYFKKNKNHFFCIVFIVVIIEQKTILCFVTQKTICFVCLLKTTQISYFYFIDDSLYYFYKIIDCSV